jgi:hypothetical protein
MTTYMCPNCHDEHAEPSTAAYEIHVLCLACDLARERERAKRSAFDAARPRSKPRGTEAKAA